MIFSFFRPVCCFAEPICAPHFLESHFIPQVRVQVVIKWAPKQHSIWDLVGRWSGSARRAVPSARPGRRRRPRRTWRLPRRRLPGRRLPGAPTSRARAWRAAARGWRRTADFVTADNRAAPFSECFLAPSLFLLSGYRRRRAIIIMKCTRRKKRR